MHSKTQFITQIYVAAIKTFNYCLNMRKIEKEIETK